MDWSGTKNQHPDNPDSHSPDTSSLEMDFLSLLSGPPSLAEFIELLQDTKKPDIDLGKMKMFLTSYFSKKLRKFFGKYTETDLRMVTTL